LVGQLDWWNFPPFFEANLLASLNSPGITGEPNLFKPWERQRKEGWKRLGKLLPLLGIGPKDFQLLGFLHHFTNSSTALVGCIKEPSFFLHTLRKAQETLKGPRLINGLGRFGYLKRPLFGPRPLYLDLISLGQCFLEPQARFPTTRSLEQTSTKLRGFSPQELALNLRVPKRNPFGRKHIGIPSQFLTPGFFTISTERGILPQWGGNPWGTTLGSTLGGTFSKINTFVCGDITGTLLPGSPHS